jgi:hypothetical protein
MRRDVLLLAVICCSLLDHCAARLAHCFREGHSTGPTPKIECASTAQRCLANHMKIDQYGCFATEPRPTELEWALGFVTHGKGEPLMTRAKRVLVGAAIGAMVGIVMIGINGADVHAQTAAGNIAGLIGSLLPATLIGAVIGLFVKRKQRAMPEELNRGRDNWSDEEKETFRNLMNKGD